MFRNCIQLFSRFTLIVFLMLFCHIQTARAVDQSTLNSMVRVRLFKDLNEFPNIQNAQIGRINSSMWSLVGVNLIFQSKKIPTENIVVRKENKKFDLISVIDFNAYLAGVISSEMPISWPLEALKAQAVVARSYALARMKERKYKLFHLDSDQMDQVFKMNESSKAAEAVAQTENIILKTLSGAILKAFYHADCGGQTVPAHLVWKSANDTGTATDPWCASRKSNEWTFNVSKEAFFRAISLEPQADVVELSLFKKRIQSVQIADQFFSIQKLREIFGFSNIRNSPLSIMFDEENVQILGKGFGHGVGLCQWGTYEQTKRGQDYVSVLQHYYPKAIVSHNEMRLSQITQSDFVSN